MYHQHMDAPMTATAAGQSPAGREGIARGVFTKQTQFGKTNPFSRPRRRALPSSRFRLRQGFAGTGLPVRPVRPVRQAHGKQAHGKQAYGKQAHGKQVHGKQVHGKQAQDFAGTGPIGGPACLFERHVIVLAAKYTEAPRRCASRAPRRINTIAEDRNEPRKEDAWKAGSGNGRRSTGIMPPRESAGAGTRRQRAVWSDPRQPHPAHTLAMARRKGNHADA